VRITNSKFVANVERLSIAFGLLLFAMALSANLSCSEKSSFKDAGVDGTGGHTGGTSEARPSGGESDGGRSSSLTGTAGNTTDTGGTSTSSSSEGGSSAIGGTTATTTSKPFALVEDGADCSPIAARACASENTVSQMVCSAGSVWQWASDCGAGTVCDPRPGLKVGQCIEPDTVCASGNTTSCNSITGVISNCISPGFVVSSEVCSSAKCADSKSCKPWDPCEAWWSAETRHYDCTGQCEGLISPECKTPNGVGVNGIRKPDGCNYRTAVAVPPASALPTIAGCPDTHVFWVMYEPNGCVGAVSFKLPPQYMAVRVSRYDAITDMSSVENLACNWSSGSEKVESFTPYNDEAVLVITKDASAPGFRLVFD
jgi:hypothetical protein